MRFNDFEKYLKKEKIGLALIFNSKLKDPNFFYFSNVNPDDSILLISPKFPAKVYCSPLEFLQYKNKSIIKNFYEITKKSRGNILKLVRKYRIKKIGVSFSSLTVKELKRLKKMIPKVKFVDITMPLRELRAVKTTKELVNIKKACSLSEMIWKKAVKKIKRLKTESKLRDFIDNEIKKLRCENAFPTIVASGKNSAIPHYSPQNKNINGFCVVDFGVKYNGYCSDITRTIFVGKANKKDKEMYDLVYKTKEYAFSLIKKGVKAAKVSMMSRKFLGKYGKYFIHGLGHGFGIEIHEFPSMKENSWCHFVPNMVFTIEPGVYFKNKYGIRIEDDYLLTYKGVVRLTKAPSKLLNI